MNWFKKKFPFVLAYLLVPSLAEGWLNMTEKISVCFSLSVGAQSS